MYPLLGSNLVGILGLLLSSCEIHIRATQLNYLLLISFFGNHCQGNWFVASSCYGVFCCRLDEEMKANQMRKEQVPRAHLMLDCAQKVAGLDSSSPLLITFVLHDQIFNSCNYQL